MKEGIKFYVYNLSFLVLVFDTFFGGNIFSFPFACFDKRVPFLYLFLI